MNFKSAPNPGIKKKRKNRMDFTLDREVCDKLDKKSNMSGFVNKILRREFNLDEGEQA